MKYRVARFRVRPDSLEPATAAIRTFAEGISEHEPGTLRWDSFLERDGRSVVQVMAFETSEAEEIHRHTTHRSRFLAELSPLVEQDPVLSELVPIASVGAPDLRARNIHHRVRLPVHPERVYRALLDPKDHAAFTGLPAAIDPVVGGQFSTCGERSWGWTLELIPNRRIVQAWRHRDWPEGTWSTATFALSPHESMTDLHFMQTGVPSESFSWVDAMWKTTYWAALDRWLRRDIKLL